MASERLTLPGPDDGERKRFDSYIVRGPRPTDCFLWRGSIADDGYGRN